MIKIKDLFNHYIKAFILLVICLAVGFVAILAAYAIPTDKIENHVFKTDGVFEIESEYFSVTKSITGTLLDNYTDAIYLNMAMVDDDNGLIETALSGYEYEIDGTGVSNLISTFNDLEKSELVPISCRFWNGYEIFVKLALLFVGYSRIRQFNMYAELFLTVLLFYLLYKKGLGKFIIPIGISFLLMHPITLALCMSFSGFYYVTLIASILMLIFNDKLDEKKYFFFFEIVGCCSFYFNMNYFQLITYGVTITLYFLINGFPKKVSQLIKTMLYFFVAWFIGFAGMMIGKWILYAIFCDSNIFVDMYNNIMLRLSSNVDGDNISRIDALKQNMFIAFIDNWQWSIIEIGYLGFILIGAIRTKKFIKKFNIIYFVFIVLMILLPVVRILIFANHTYIHAWVTYRLFMIPIISINVIIVLLFSKNQELEKNNNEN